MFNNEGFESKKNIGDRLRKRYNELKTLFKDQIERLKHKKDLLKDVQRRYFKASTRYRREKNKFWDNHETAQSKRKVEEYFQRKEALLKNYKIIFREFKQMYEASNYKFETRMKDWLRFDSLLKKDYVKIWEKFSAKLLGIFMDSPIMLGLPDLEDIFEDVLPETLDKVEVNKTNIYSKATNDDYCTFNHHFYEFIKNKIIIQIFLFLNLNNFRSSRNFKSNKHGSKRIRYG